MRQSSLVKKSCPLVLPLLLAVALSAPAAEPLVSTAWDVRKEAKELLDELAAKRGDEGGLFERVQALLLAHGDSLVPWQGGAAPLSEVLPAKLKEVGLDQAFVAAYAAVAERKRRELADGHAGDGDWQALARAFPGTPAAQTVWKQLADGAWDRGRLGDYLAYAVAAGDATNTAAKARIDAALTLVTRAAHDEPPLELKGLSEIWRIDLDQEKLVTPARAKRSHSDDEGPAEPAPFTITTADAEVSAASDGIRFGVFDHLVGRLQGALSIIGNTPVPVEQCKPVATRAGFVALGMQDSNRVTLTALDRNGELRWRYQAPDGALATAVSAPVVLGNLVAYAALVWANNASELRVIAIDERTGKPLWDVLVARVPAANRWGNDNGTRPPALCVHAGGLLALSNGGVLARIAANGSVRRLWSYPSLGDGLPGGIINSRRTVPRRGSLISDGRTAVATPADGDRLALVVGPDDAEPRQYRGDGAGGEVVAVGNGIAVLAGAITTAVDLATLKPRWSATTRLVDPQAVMGDGRLLLRGRDSIVLLDAVSGKSLGARSAEKAFTLAVTSQVLLIGNSGVLRAFGGSTSFLERLTAAAAANPQDHRPLVALASLMQSRNQPDQAFAFLVQALERHAPAEYAERAARLCRSRLDLAAGDARAFPPLLANLATLVRFDAELAGESAYWQARHDEALNDRGKAATGYEAVLRAPGRMITVRDGVAVHVQVLAQAGLARCRPGAPSSLIERPTPPVLATAPSAWTRPGHRGRRLVLGGELAVGYANGVLCANRLNDGSEAWWRAPDRPLLGVQWNPSERTDGIEIKVMVGTSAAAAGFANGDLLTEFNGAPMRNFQADLIPAVKALTVRTPFTAVVQRQGAAVQLSGVLGGEMLEPIAANTRTVIVGTVLPGGQLEGMTLLVHDLATGAELFRHTIPPVLADQAAPVPLLTPNDVVVLPDGGDLVGLRAHARDGAAPGSEVWRRPGEGAALATARLVGTAHLWVSDVAHGSGQLIAADTGAVLCALPINADGPVTIDGFEVLARLGDGVLGSWDVGLGRSRWRTDHAITALVAVSGDTLVVVNEQRQLALLDRPSGQTRRAFGQWSAINIWARHADALYVHTRDGEGRQSLAAIALPGGSVKWEAALPMGVEVRQIQADARGVVVELVDDASLNAVAFAAVDGAVRQVLPASPGDDAFIGLNDTILHASPSGLTLTRDGLAAVAPRLPASVHTDVPDLSKLAQAVVSGAQWQAVGDAAYALVRIRNSWVMLGRLGAKQTELVVQIADGNRAIDQLGQAVEFSATANPCFKDRAGGWRMSAGVPLVGAAQPTFAVRLEPDQNRVSGLPIVVRGAAGAFTDVPDVPRWLASHWRLVQVPAAPATPTP